MYKQNISAYVRLVNINLFWSNWYQTQIVNGWAKEIKIFKIWAQNEAIKSTWDIGQECLKLKFLFDCLLDQKAN